MLLRYSQVCTSPAPVTAQVDGYGNLRRPRTGGGCLQFREMKTQGKEVVLQITDVIFRNCRVTFDSSKRPYLGGALAIHTTRLFAAAIPTLTATRVVFSGNSNAPSAEKYDDVFLHPYKPNIFRNCRFDSSDGYYRITGVAKTCAEAPRDLCTRYSESLDFQYPQSNDSRRTSYACMMSNKDGPTCTSSKGYFVSKFSSHGFPQVVKQCGSNTFADKTNMSTCLTCPYGFESPPGSAKCTETCKKFNLTYDDEQCKECEEGKYSTKSAGCRECTIGLYANVRGSQGCKKCPKGFYANLPQSVACKQCPEGWFTDWVAGNECRACPSGWMHMNASTCGRCHVGQYAEGESSTMCKKCSVGRFAEAEGSTACAMCPSGWISKENYRDTCIGCQPGTFSNGRVCELCRSGFYQISEKQSQCQVCVAGTFQAQMGQIKCKECEPGRYSEEEGQPACKECSHGSYSEGRGSTSCSKCIPGGLGSRKRSDVCNLTLVSGFGWKDGSCAGGLLGSELHLSWESSIFELRRVECRFAQDAVSRDVCGSGCSVISRNLAPVEMEERAARLGESFRQLGLLMFCRLQDATGQYSSWSTPCRMNLPHGSACPQMRAHVLQMTWSQEKVFGG